MNRVLTSIGVAIVCFVLLLFVLCVFGLLILGFSAFQAMVNIPNWVILAFVALIAICCGVAGKDGK